MASILSPHNAQKTLNIPDYNSRFFETFYRDKDELGMLIPDGFRETNTAKLAKEDKEYFVPMHAKNWSVEAIKNANRGKMQDTYFSLNPVCSGKARKKENIKQLNWLFADIDCFHNPESYKDKTFPEVLADIIATLEEHNIPRPTAIVYSGRGFYLLWRLKQDASDTDTQTIHESIKAKKRWMRINTQINEVLVEFDADVKIAKDYARVFRVPGSTNIKANSVVTILEFHPENTYTLWDMDKAMNNCGEATEAQFDLLDEMMMTLNDTDADIFGRRSIRRYIKKNHIRYMTKKYGKASEKQLKFCMDLERKTGIKMPKSAEWEYAASAYIEKCLKVLSNQDSSARKSKTGEFVPQSINGAYISMYKKRLRIIEESIAFNNRYDGYRETTLFLVRLYNLYLTNGDKDAAMREVRRINSMFSHPLPEKEMTAATKSAESYFDGNVLLKYSTERFCENIGISVETYHSYDGACDKEVRRERNRRYYEKKRAEEGRLSVQDKKAGRQMFIESYFFDNGMTYKEIAEKMNLSESTIRRDVAEIQERRLEEAIAKEREMKRLEEERLKEQERKRIQEAKRDFFRRCAIYNKIRKQEYEREQYLRNNTVRKQECKKEQYYKKQDPYHGISVENGLLLDIRELLQNKRAALDEYLAKHNIPQRQLAKTAAAMQTAGWAAEPVNPCKIRGSGCFQNFRRI